MSLQFPLLPSPSSRRGLTQLKTKTNALDAKTDLQWASSTWDPLPFDAEAARVYGRMFAATRAAGQSSRSRLADLLIASTAAANSLPLYTRNPSDFDALKAIIKLVHI